jgi:hypothetical protein
MRPGSSEQGKGFRRELAVLPLVIVSSNRSHPRQIINSRAGLISGIIKDKSLGRCDGPLVICFFGSAFSALDCCFITMGGLGIPPVPFFVA